MSGYIYSQCAICGLNFDDGSRNYSVPKHDCSTGEIKEKGRWKKSDDFWTKTK